MKNFGFVKVAAGRAEVALANPTQNAIACLKLIKQAYTQGVRVLVLPELSLTGSTCGDLLLKSSLHRAAEESLQTLLEKTKTWDIIFIVGMPVCTGTSLLNAAVVCYRGDILGVIPKTYLPNNGPLCDTRWFVPALAWNKGEISLCGQTVPAGTDLLFQAGGFTFGVELGADLMAVVPPSSRAVLQGAEVIFNLSCGAAQVGRLDYLRQTIAQQSARGLCGYVYAGCGAGESSTDLVFSGDLLIYENGKLLASAPRFAQEGQLLCAEIDVQHIRNERLQNSAFRTGSALESNEPYEVVLTHQPVVPVAQITREITPLPFVPQEGEDLDKNCREVLCIAAAGLKKRLQAAHAQTAIIGISGGLDSTLALLITVCAFDELNWPRKNIIGITMPSFGTTDRTHDNAVVLMKKLKISQREIPIEKSCLQHFKDIGHNGHTHNAAFENAQARERTQVLMDVANQLGGLVVGTGDLSELALGWATYNGDHMSMYGVNAGIPKTLVRFLVAWAAQHQEDKQIKNVLLDIVDTPISPELLPAKNGKITQKTEDLVGPYELHDFFLYHFVRNGFEADKILFLAQHAFGKKFTEPVLRKWLSVFFKRFFAQQFKRSCMPDGPKVGSVGLSPRGDFKMPSDAQADEFLL